jgi:hypothetical protein
MDNWDQQAIDLVQPGFIEFGEDGLGSLGFIVVTGELDCRDADRDGQRGSSSREKAPTRATTRAAAAGPRSTSTARSRATSTSTSVTIPGSAPSGSACRSGSRTFRRRSPRAASAAAVSPRDLATLREAGEIDELSRGVYRRADAEPTAHLDLLAVCTRAPHAVVCGESALSLHELIDDIPHEVHIAVPRGSHRPSISYPPTKVSQYAAGTFDFAAERFEVSPGETVPVYSAARAVVDAMRLGQAEGHGLALSALKRYLRRTGQQGVADLQRAARTRRNAGHPAGHRSSARLMPGPARDTTAGRIYNDLRNLARRRSLFLILCGAALRPAWAARCSKCLLIQRCSAPQEHPLRTGMAIDYENICYHEDI